MEEGKRDVVVFLVTMFGVIALLCVLMGICPLPA